jgi:ubiquinone biosynthesis protein UbiJ
MAAMSGVLDFLKPLVEGGVNRALRTDPDMAARLAQLAGRVCRIELTDLGVTFDVAPDATGLRLSPAGSQPPDVTLRGSLLAIARLATGNGRLPASSRAEIAGDAELANSFARALREFDPDWEEELSRYVGDVPAHLIGKTFRAARAWAGDARTRLDADVAEYLREEVRLLPDRAAVAAFIAEVDRLRADADRLAARVENLLRSRRP